jgi:hypothetical protein
MPPSGVCSRRIGPADAMVIVVVVVSKHNKTQLLASDYRTFLLAKAKSFRNPKGTLYSRHRCDKLRNNVKRHDSRGSH